MDAHRRKIAKGTGQRQWREEDFLTKQIGEVGIELFCSQTGERGEEKYTRTDKRICICWY